MQRNTGILGGSFNPIHNGHLSLANGFRSALGLDRVLLIPVASPPHKSGEGMADGAARFEMCRLACAGTPWLEPCDIELKRGGTSYTSDTLVELSRIFPDDRLYLLMGADMFLTLEQWHEFGTIARLASLCSTQRRCENGGGSRELYEYANRLTERYHAQCYIGDLPPVDLSSTQVRRKLGRGENVEGLVPAAVCGFISRLGLYKPPVSE